MSKPAAIAIPLTHPHRTGAVGILFLVAIATVLLLGTMLLLVRGAPPEAIDALTSPAAIVGRTS
jgi:hypothetical protein